MKCLLVCVMTASMSTGALAGDLNPPGGPVLPTMKTLQEVEPRVIINATNTPGDANSIYRITQPGSYYLTDNIDGLVGMHGIEIASHRVTIDLNGFAMTGIAGTLDGISTDGAQRFSISIKNGHIWLWRGDGIAGGNGLIQDGRVENIIAVANSGTGIALGDAAVVTGCNVSDNGFHGISVQIGGVITSCSSRANSFSGIAATKAAVITACHAGFNHNIGIEVTDDSVVRGCSVSENWSDGIRCGSDNLIVRNQCDNNGVNSGNGPGIRVTSSGNWIDQNLLTDNDTGVRVSVPTGNFIVRNVANGNTISNWSIPGGNSFGTPVNTPVGAGAWDNFNF